MTNTRRQVAVERNVNLKIHEESSDLVMDRSPFENTESLYNITTAVTAGSKVTVDRAEFMGKDIVTTISDQNVLNFLVDVRIKPPTCKQQVLQLVRKP